MVDGCIKITQPSACSQNDDVPDLRRPLRVVVKTQASPNVRLEKNGDGILIFPLSRVLKLLVREHIFVEQ